MSARSTEHVALLWHDLRQSVAVILASATAAEEDPSLGPEARRWLRHVSEEARRISRICEHAVRAGTAPQALQSLEEVAASILDSLRVVYSTDIEYRRSGEDVNIDGAAVERALANVVDNACRAAGPEGRVCVAIVVAPESSVIITVDDDGPGFEALDERSRGIGLDVTRRMVDQLGGSLEIAERGPLGGARVRVILATCSPQASSGSAA
jgi:signal transduction histidine kinase